MLYPRLADKARRQQRHARFKQKVNDYLAFCQIEAVNQFKRNALAYYLKTIAAYLQHHPVERVIIQYLRKDDRKIYEKQFADDFARQGHEVETFLTETSDQLFERFQFLVMRLLVNPSEKAIHAFINAHPVRYDPASDRFVRTDGTYSRARFHGDDGV